MQLDRTDLAADVLVIGGGGAGCAAALEAQNTGASVLLITKLRVGDANTMMAEGGIQAADKPNDSPAIHYLTPSEAVTLPPRRSCCTSWSRRPRRPFSG